MVENAKEERSVTTNGKNVLEKIVIKNERINELCRISEEAGTLFDSEETKNVQHFFGYSL